MLWGNRNRSANESWFKYNLFFPLANHACDRAGVPYSLSNSILLGSQLQCHTQSKVMSSQLFCTDHSHTCKRAQTEAWCYEQKVVASKRKENANKVVGERRLQKRYEPPTLKGYVWYKLSHPQFSFFSVKNGKNKKSVGPCQFPCVLAFNCRTVDMHHTILSKWLQSTVSACIFRTR